MDNNNLIDDQSLEVDFYAEVLTKNKTYTLRVLLLMLLITILYPICMIDENTSTLERITDSFIYTIVVAPSISLLLSIPLACLPYKDLFLHQKYKRTLLLTLLCLNTAFILLLIFIGVFA